MGFLNDIIKQIKADDTEEQTKLNEDLPWDDFNVTKNDKEYSIKSKISKNPKRAATIGLVIIVLVIVCIALFNYFNKPSMIIEKDENGQANTEITIHIAGEVLTPGVYKLSSGARIIDAVNMAGGFGANAIKDDLNLAKTLSDGEQIIIKSTASTNASSSNNSSSNSSDSNSGSSSSSQQNSGKININTASSSELQTLSGVGPSTAQKIIDYRNTNGKFKTIDDIKNVSGIGEKTFAKFSDKICV